MGSVLPVKCGESPLGLISSPNLGAQVGPRVLQQHHGHCTRSLHLEMEPVKRLCGERSPAHNNLRAMPGQRFQDMSLNICVCVCVCDSGMPHQQHECKPVKVSIIQTCEDFSHSLKGSMHEFFQGKCACAREVRLSSIHSITVSRNPKWPSKFNEQILGSLWYFSCNSFFLFSIGFLGLSRLVSSETSSTLLW